MPLKRDITDDTRVIDLTIAELLQILTERLGLGDPARKGSAAEPAGLLDTWATAHLLGNGMIQIFSDGDLGWLG